MRNTIKGLRQSMDLLRHNVEKDAEELSKAILTTDQMRKDAAIEAHEMLAGVRSDLQEVRDYVSDLRGANGAPLSGSSEQSAQPRSSEVANR